MKLEVSLRNQFVIKDNDFSLWNAVLHSSNCIELVTENPDVVFFVDCHQFSDQSVRNCLKLVRKYHQSTRVIVYNERDRPMYDVTGLYTSLSRHAEAQRFRSVPYIRTVTSQTVNLLGEKPKLLCFRGTTTHPCRRQIPRILTDDIDIQPSTLELRNMVPKGEFREWLSQFKYSLCPRGHGPSSFRIFESMWSGSIPVVVSDEWIACHDFPWADIALFIPESGVGHVIDYVKSDIDNYFERVQKLRQFVLDFSTPNMLSAYFEKQILDVLASPANDLSFVNTYFLKFVCSTISRKIRMGISNGNWHTRYT